MARLKEYYNKEIKNYLKSKLSLENINEVPKLIKIVDVLGREATPTQNTPLFYIYENGSVEKKILIE